MIKSFLDNKERTCIENDKKTQRSPMVKHPKFKA